MLSYNVVPRASLFDIRASVLIPASHREIDARTKFF